MGWMWSGEKLIKTNQKTKSLRLARLRLEITKAAK
jgi:hypothetical protein